MVLQTYLSRGAAYALWKLLFKKIKVASNFVCQLLEPGIHVCVEIIMDATLVTSLIYPESIGAVEAYAERLTPFSVLL